MDYQQFFKNPSLQAFLLASLAIYLIFRALQYLNERFVLRLKNRKTFRKVLYFIEFISWLIFTIESVNSFINNNILVSGLLALILIAVIGWTAWFVVKDYVVGLYLKWNDAYKINESIEFNGKEGKIIHLGNRTAILEISPLHTIKIPYSQLFTKQVIRTGLTDLRANASFVINVPIEIKPAEKLEDIRTFIYQLPWANFKYKPLVAIEKQEKEKTSIRISASLHDEKYIELFEGKIREKFEQESISG